MQEVDINTLVNNDFYLTENIPNDISIVGKINKLYIEHKYDQLDLSKIDCNKIFYHNQKKESIKNHILPDSLENLSCWSNQLTSLPKLPNSLQILTCWGNQLTSFDNTQLPNSLKELNCYKNLLKSLPDHLPDSLQELICFNNQLKSLPDHLPNSLRRLRCGNNKLLNLPEINDNMYLHLIQSEPLEYITYSENNISGLSNIDINVIDYPYNPITNSLEIKKYMYYIKEYKMNRIKSARK